MKQKVLFLMMLLCLVVGKAEAQSNITWEIVAPENGGQYYIYSLVQKKYLNDNNGWDADAKILWTFSGSLEDFSLISQNDKKIATYYSWFNYHIVSNSTNNTGQSYSNAFTTAGDQNGYKFIRKDEWSLSGKRNIKSTNSFLEFTGEPEFEFVFVSKTQYDNAKKLKNTAQMKVQANTYGTFCAPFEVAIPSSDGIKAYTVTERKSGAATLVLLEITDKIPANTPVVLENTKGNLYDQEKTGDVVYTSQALTNGLLTGVFADTPAPVGSYVLQRIDGKVYFYKVEANEEPTVGANRAYLTIANSQVKFFDMQVEDATAIQSLVNGETLAIYDINGISQKSLKKGMNIIKLSNGKTQKVLVK